MTPERAEEIVNAINDRCLLTMGLVEKVGALDGVSLADMIEAAGLMRERNEKAPSIDGKRIIKVVPADRLIAAAYCLQNYPPSKEAIAVVPASHNEAWSHEGDLKALAVFVINSKTAVEDAE